jgi:hypothetical protein
VFSTERQDLDDEFPEILEEPINRGVPDVRDLIELVQFVHHLASDDMRRNLLLKILLELLNHFLRSAREGLVRNGAFFTRLGHAVEQLVLVKRLGATVALHHP